MLDEKIILLALMELALRRPAGARSLPFADIAAATRTAADKVEWIVMRALSLGLIKGTIDEVDAVVHVSFVKPRVLSLAQIVGLKGKVEEWMAKTNVRHMGARARAAASSPLTDPPPAHPLTADGL